ncbi:MAG TPA: amino acid adenylation domain-containing protein, partial [Thermoanaerobaculia bacterium]|nr:amino acid adenylation domain-containing protein [Thermoanaerobaculia bacterium]
MAEPKALPTRRARLSEAKRALLSQRIRGSRGAAAGAADAIPRREESGPAPLSFGQRRLWFLDRLAPGSSTYTCATELRLSGALDLGAFLASLREIVRRHHVLRSVIRVVDGEPVQAVSSVPALPLAVADLSRLPGERALGEARRLAAEEGGRPFRLDIGPLLRVGLLRLGGGRHVFLLTVHHVAWDGWSAAVFFSELVQLYGDLRARRRPRLPEPAIQYGDFAAWQARWMSGEVLDRALGYWRQRLEGAPRRLALQPDRPRPAVQTTSGGAVGFEVAPGLTDGLRALARRFEATPFMVLLAAYQALLARITGQMDLLVGTTVAGRHRVELEGLIGFFVSTLVLRGDLSGDPSWGELLARVRETTLADFAREELPFEKLVEELQPERTMDRSPLFQAAFTYQRAEAPRLDLVPGLSVVPMDGAGASAKFEITLDVVDHGSRLAASLEYNRDLFDAATARRMARQLLALCHGITADPGRRLSDLPLLGRAEQHQVYREWGAAARAVPPRAELHAAAAAPASVAVRCGGEALSCGELAGRSRRLARLLRSRGVGAEVPVGLCVDRSVEMVVALQAILEAGGVCVPLDPGYPPVRLEAMLEDAGVAFVVTRRRLLSGLPERARACELICLDGEPAGFREPEVLPPDPHVPPEALAYLIFTSGSTGRPKAVGVSRGALAAHVEGMRRAFGLAARDRVLQFASLSFDVALEQILTALAAGASLVVRGDEVWSPRELDRRIREQGLTVVNLPTGYCEQWLQESEGRDPPSLRLVIAGGDLLSPAAVRRWLAAPRAHLLNAYGPTEGVVTSTLGEVARQEPGAAVSVGRPLPGRRVYLVDGAGVPVTPGTLGEICLSEPLLARGYLRRPAETAERFVPDPLAGTPGRRLYWTGDLARWRHDGQIEFFGRGDRQVKLRGFRIELGEVEDRLSRVPGVLQSAVVMREDRPGDRRLVGYAVPRPGARLDGDEVRRELARQLPEPLVPSALVVLEALPLTPNGKVDRRALPAPEWRGAEAGFVAPRTPVEEVVAGIWSEVLGLDRVGVTEGFFALGGHSLLATRVLSRVVSAFGIELPLVALFEEPTVAGLAARVEAALGGETAAALPPLVPVPRTGEPLPLSFAQQRLWFLGRLEPESALYNLPVALRLLGVVELGALVWSLREVVRRHEALRTAFREVAGEPVQVILPSARLPVPVVDLGGLPGERREREARRLAAAEAARPFDLAWAPLLRVALLRSGPREHAALVTLHHVVSDGWSMELMTGEVAALYRAALAREPSPLPELPVQYADFAVWQRSWLAGDALAAEVAHWRERLAGLPGLLELPVDRPRPSRPSFRGATRTVALGTELTGDLRRLARERGGTLFMVLLAAFQALLSRWSGQVDFAVGSPVAGRNRQELEGLIGFFVNTLVLRANLAGDPTLNDLLGRVRSEVLEAHAHQHLPFEKLVEELEPERSLIQSPLFQVMLTRDDRAFRPAELGSELALAPFGLPSRSAKFDLTLGIDASGDAAGCGLEYNTDLFDCTTAERLLKRYRLVLVAVADRPATRLAELPLLTRAERHQVTAEWCGGPTPYPREATIHGLFAEQAAELPDAVAVEVGSELLTYGALARCAAGVARHLRPLGAGPGTTVGLCMERSVDLVVAMVGVVQA